AERAGASDERRGRVGGEPDEIPGAVRDVDPELADEPAARRLLRIDEVGVVAAERVPASDLRDDPMQHDRVQRATAVGDDVPHAVVAGAPYDREVARMEARLHARSRGDDVVGGTAERGGREERPERRAHHDAESGGSKLAGW